MADTGQPPIVTVRLDDLQDQINDLAGIFARALYVGKIELKEMDPDDLPAILWYHANGDRWPTASPQGLALASLSGAYKDQWGITVVDGTINVPSYYASDGRGYFERAVDGEARLPGSVQGDATIDAEGSIIQTWGGGFISPEGVFDAGSYVNLMHGSTSHGAYQQVTFKLSRSIGTDKVAAEIRPLNVGKTPAIYLGV
jgi:hypothetical protein